MAREHQDRFVGVGVLAVVDDLQIRRVATKPFHDGRGSSPSSVKQALAQGRVCTVIAQGDPCEKEPLRARPPA